MKVVGPEPDDHSAAEEEGAVAASPGIEDGPTGFDEAAESAFRAEARERGEVVAAKPTEIVEDSDPKKLPPLDDLVNRIPPGVRDVLEDLFRARFVSVKKFPKKYLKSEAEPSAK